MSDLRIRTIFEVIGLLAIVGSLIFVGLQMKQSHEIALVNLYQMRSDAAREVRLGTISTLISYAEINEDSPVSDSIVLQQIVGIIMNHFESAHYLYQRGYLEEEHWESDLQQIARSLNSQENFREIWELTKDSYRPSFVQAVKRILENNGT